MDTKRYNVKSFNMKLVPFEVWILIFERLDFKSLVRATAVCRLWNKNGNEQHLWRRLCLLYRVSIEWGVQFKPDVNEVDTLEDHHFSIKSIQWKESFIQHYLTQLRKKKSFWAGQEAVPAPNAIAKSIYPEFLTCLQCENEKNMTHLMSKEQTPTSRGGHAARDILRMSEASLDVFAFMQGSMPASPRSTLIHHTFSNNCQFGNLLKNFTPAYPLSPPVTPVGSPSNTVFTPTFSTISQSNQFTTSDSMLIPSQLSQLSLDQSLTSDLLLPRSQLTDLVNNSLFSKKSFLIYM